MRALGYRRDGSSLALSFWDNRWGNSFGQYLILEIYAKNPTFRVYKKCNNRW